MIVWGGATTGVTNTGGVYDPATDTWTATSTTGAPTPRDGHTAVETGSRMVIWGGSDPLETGTGGIYDPTTDTWTATSATGAPAPRRNHTAVWTGSRMIVWGGTAGGNANTGGIYDNPAVSPLPVAFYTVTPCRVVDTRNAAGPTGGPALVASSTRGLPVTGSPCGIPSTAVAVSVNLTAVGATAAGHLTLFPGDWFSPPLVSHINFPPGVARANNAVVPLATDGTGTIQVKNGSAGAVHFVLDVNGYFQ